MLRAQERASQSAELGPWVSTPQTLALVAQDILDRIATGWAFQAVVTRPGQADRYTNDPAGLKELDVRSGPDEITLSYQEPMPEDLGAIEPDGRRRWTAVSITLSRWSGVRVWIHAKTEEEATAKLAIVKEILSRGSPPFSSLREKPYLKGAISVVGDLGTRQARDDRRPHLGRHIMTLLRPDTKDR
jgi:hypothetical protein